MADFCISLAGADLLGSTADGHLMHTDPCLFSPSNIYFRVMRLQLSYFSVSIREPKGMRGMKQKSAPRVKTQQRSTPTHWISFIPCYSRGPVNTTERFVKLCSVDAEIPGRAEELTFNKVRIDMAARRGLLGGTY